MVFSSPVLVSPVWCIWRFFLPLPSQWLLAWFPWRFRCPLCCAECPGLVWRLGIFCHSIYDDVVFLLSMSITSLAISPPLSPSSSSVFPSGGLTVVVPIACISSLIICLMVSLDGLVCWSLRSSSADAFSPSSPCNSVLRAARSALLAFDFTCVSSFFTLFSMSLKLAAIFNTSFTMPRAVTLQYLQYHLIDSSLFSERKVYVAVGTSWHFACNHLQHRSHSRAWSLLVTAFLQSGHWEEFSPSSSFPLELALPLRLPCR